MDIIFSVDIEHACLRVLLRSHCSHKYGDNKNLVINGMNVTLLESVRYWRKLITGHGN
jgi:hypothetical protein